MLIGNSSMNWRHFKSLMAKRWLLAAAFVLLAALGSLAAVGITQTIAETAMPEMVSSEIMKQGAQLRQDIERAYRKARSKNTLKPGATRGLDITGVVERWIPVGTSFEDAEAILKAAHFEVEARPSEAMPPGSLFWQNHPGRFAVGAKLVLDSNIFSTVKVGVALYPELPFRYEQVNRVEAHLFLLSL